MADEYIRRQDAVSAVNHALDRETLLFSFVRKVAISALKKIAPADVVQVVRCKDCKHVYCRIYHGWQEPIYTCTHLRSRWNTDNDLEVNPDGFCSCGERREE